MERSTGDVPRGIANSEENEALAGSLPMFPSLKSHFIGLAGVGYHPSLKAVKQVELADSQKRRKMIERELKTKTLELANEHSDIDSCISVIRHRHTH